MPKDLWGFLTGLAGRPADLVTVTRPIHPDAFEATAILQHLDDRREYPAVLFERPTNVLGQPSEVLLVSNVFGTRERCARALDFPEDQSGLPLSLEFARRERQHVPAVTIPPQDAPVRAHTWQGAEADVRKLPVVRHFEMDLGPVLTMGLAMKALDGEFYDISFCKGFIHGPRRLGISIHTPHLERLQKQYWDRKARAPVVFILGHHPAFWLGALALTPFGSNDYDTIGGFLGEPLRLTPSVTWGDRFLIPADAEVVIEGEMPPDELEPVDPFGEVTRHYQAQCLRPVMEVTAISFRERAVMQDIFSGHRGHWNLGVIPKEGSLYNKLQQKFGCIKAVHLPYSGCGRFLVYVSMRKDREGVAKVVGHTALHDFPLFQIAVVVDEDIDVFNESDVIWSVVTNVNPDRDVDVVRNSATVFTTAMGYTKLVIDATRPLDVPFPAPMRVPEDAMRKIRVEDWVKDGTDLLDRLPRVR
ncbi:MAG: UbiD family decarboxylase [Deltaproteobacteria bacterium]|nr:UbiD family decarboxylase [Deltaproteobacteria bacterium]